MYQDPYFQDVPWEIYYDEHGQVIGAVYVLMPKRNDGYGDKAKSNSKVKGIRRNGRIST